MSRRQTLRGNLSAMAARQHYPPPPREPPLPRRLSPAPVQRVAPTSGTDSTTAPPEPCQRPPETPHVAPADAARRFAETMHADAHMFDALARQVAAEDDALAYAVGLDLPLPDDLAEPVDTGTPDDDADAEW
jgi:hypothetical protein